MKNACRISADAYDWDRIVLNWSAIISRWHLNKAGAVCSVGKNSLPLREESHFAECIVQSIPAAPAEFQVGKPFPDLCRPVACPHLFKSVSEHITERLA